jgi:hypothetical protein
MVSLQSCYDFIWNFECKLLEACDQILMQVEVYIYHESHTDWGLQLRLNSEVDCEH